VWNVGAQLRLSFHTVVDPVHPLVPPPESFGDEVDSGAGSGLMGIVVGPWTQQRVNRRGFGVGAPATIRVVHEAEKGGSVFVEQSSDGEDGNLDGGRCLSHRSVLPVVVTTLVAEPVLDVHRGLIDAPFPVL